MATSVTSTRCDECETEAPTGGGCGQISRDAEKAAERPSGPYARAISYRQIQTYGCHGN